jgi:hypothetical protein
MKDASPTDGQYIIKSVDCSVFEYDTTGFNHRSIGRRCACVLLGGALPNLFLILGTKIQNSIFYFHTSHKIPGIKNLHPIFETLHRTPHLSINAIEEHP